MKKNSFLKIVGTASLVGLMSFFFLNLRGSEELLCEGTTPETNLKHRVVFIGKNDSSGYRPTRFDTWVDSKWKPEATDRRAAIKGEGEHLTVTMNPGDNKHIQITKGCEKPVKCEIRRYEVPDAKTLREEQAQQAKAEREAYELRLAADRQAREIDVAKAKAESASRKFAELKKLKIVSKQDLESALSEKTKAVGTANEIFGRYLNLSASAHEATKMAAQLKSNSSLNQVKIATEELKPENVTSWCK